jgi:hypothetical protein
MSTASVTADGGSGQLRALLALRWRMLRSPRQRRALVAVLSLLPFLAVGAVIGGQLAPENLRLNFATIAPTVFASFFALAVISPASSAGGSELFPSDQLTAYPINDRTVFRSTVLLAPANLAWMTSFLALLGITSYAADRGPLVALSAITVMTYAVTATLVGQALAWLLEGVRQRQPGRWAIRGVAALLALAGLTIQLTGNLTDALDKLPTTRIALSANFGAQGRYGDWVVPVVAMLVTGVAALVLGQLACRWTQGRVSDGGLQPETRPVRRRPTATSDLRALMQVDRASVWRSAPLRRGAIVMAVLPGAIAAVTEPRWDSLVLLTGLVAAGSGLLFGVNAFGMDGPGALTLEGLPVAPELRFWAKTLIIIEFAALTEVALLS